MLDRIIDASVRFRWLVVALAAIFAAFGLQTLRDLPDIEALEDAGLLSRKEMLDETLPPAADDDGEE